VPWEIFEREASRYEGWYETPRGRRADEAEQSLLAWLLGWFPGARRVLEVGSGTGHFTRWLAARGFSVIGLDRSPAMLRVARTVSASPLLLADAHRLPVHDGAVDVVVLITTLEFLECPGLALQESVRAAERGLALVVLNQWSLGAASRRWGPQSRGALLADAHDRSPPRLRQEIRWAAGGRLRRLHWRTALLPRPFDRVLTRVPGGDVIGMAAELSSPAPRQGANFNTRRGGRAAQGPPV
jgi:SAM-dependent methyltransferase